jgi:cytochrome b pre-mRNA-processing protein 3
MIFNLFSRAKPAAGPEALYSAIVEQAREPGFFAPSGFPDTVTGRLDVLILHMVLAGRRLAAENDEQAKSLSQDIFDRFVDELDDALRALGVGDTSVPKKKKRMVHGYYGQLSDFTPPIDAADVNGLAAAMMERFKLPPQASQRLAAYALAAAHGLSQNGFSQLARGAVSWPAPPQMAKG